MYTTNLNSNIKKDDKNSELNEMEKNSQGKPCEKDKYKINSDCVDDTDKVSIYSTDLNNYELNDQKDKVKPEINRETKNNDENKEIIDKNILKLISDEIKNLASDESKNTSHEK